MVDIVEIKISPTELRELLRRFWLGEATIDQIINELYAKGYANVR